MVTFPWTYWDKAFTDEELDRVVAQCLTWPVKEAELLGSVVDDSIRTSSIRWVRPVAESPDNPGTQWIFERLNNVIWHMNVRWFGFDLNGYDALQYTEYDGERQGKYNWHMDMCLDSDKLPAEMIEPRKLSLVMLLSAPGTFEGGDFQINMGTEEKAKTVEFIRGRIIAFPSWMIHRVKPVTSGVRRSIVIWVTGPKFT